jgi:hypothetical protein
MSIRLGSNQYGKAENRVVRVYRDTPRHQIRDLNVSTSLRGRFDDAHITGDQADVLPTDIQKNTLFAFARKIGVASIEEFGLALADRYLEASPAAEGVGRDRGVRLGPDRGRRRRPLLRPLRRRHPQPSSAVPASAAPAQRPRRRTSRCPRGCASRRGP